MTTAMRQHAISHHLTPELLLGYVAGSLPEAFNLVIATHLSLCDACRAEMAGFEAIGGALIEAAPVEVMADDSLARLMQRLAGEAPPPEPPPPARGIFPAPLRDHVGGDLEAVRWRPVGMGVKQAILPTGPGATVRLLHIPAGAAMPDHGHRGRELTLVLQGAFSDAGGRYGPGDIEVADEAVEHTPTAEPGPACICLAATDAPLRFRGLLPRLAQPFFRI